MRIKKPTDFIKKQTIIPNDPRDRARDLIRTYNFWSRLFPEGECTAEKSVSAGLQVPRHLFSSNLAGLSKALEQNPVNSHVEQISARIRDIAKNCRENAQEVDHNELLELLDEAVFYLDENQPSDIVSVDTLYDEIVNSGYRDSELELTSDAIDYLVQNDIDLTLSNTSQPAELVARNLRLKVYPSGAKLLWITGGGIDREKPIPSDSLVYKFLTPNNPYPSAIVGNTEDRIVGAAERAKRFLQEDFKPRNKILIQGKSSFVMETTGLGIRVNYRIAESLFKAVNKGNQSKIGFYDDNLESLFVHEGTHEARKDISCSGNDLTAAEAAAFSAQILNNKISSPFIQEHLKLAFNSINILSSYYSQGVVLGFRIVAAKLKDNGYKIEDYRPETVLKLVKEIQDAEETKVISQILTEIKEASTNELFAYAEQFPEHKSEKVANINNIEVWRDDNLTYPAIVLKMNGQISSMKKMVIRLSKETAIALNERFNPLNSKANEVLEKAISICEGDCVIPIKRNNQVMTLEEYSAARIMRRIDSTGDENLTSLLESDTGKIAEFLEINPLLSNPQACLLVSDYAATTNMYGMLIERDYVF